MSPQKIQLKTKDLPFHDYNVYGHYFYYYINNIFLSLSLNIYAYTQPLKYKAI